jgi:hypothetical protein
LPYYKKVLFIIDNIFANLKKNRKKEDKKSKNKKIQ